MSRFGRVSPRWAELALAAMFLLAVSGPAVAAPASEDESPEVDRGTPEEVFERIRGDAAAAEERLRPSRTCPDRWHRLLDFFERWESLAGLDRLENGSDGAGERESSRRKGESKKEYKERLGQERQDLYDGLVRIEGELKEAVEICEGRLLDAYRTLLQDVRDHSEAMRSERTRLPSPEVDRLIERAEGLLAASDTPGDYGQVEELERAADGIEAELFALDPCAEDLRLATSRIDLDSVGQSFEKLCPVIATCLYAPHAADVRRTLERRLADVEAVSGDLQPADLASLRALAEWPTSPMQRCLPGARSRIAGLLRRADARERPRPDERAPVETAERPAALTVAPVTASPVEPEPDPPARPSRSGTSGFLTLNVWQSAWGDFSDFESLASYLRRNRIRAVNLNPGFEMFDDFHDEAYGRLKPLVESLREAGVERIQFLYAELNYPVERYGRFLRKFPDLGIDAIVDDSEFTDYFVDRFRRNFARVDALGLDYAAFVTLEGYGNSGVSDETRRWAIEHLDQPILMSYFSCSVDEQLEELRPYLQFGDRLRRGRFVKVAILMGGKSVGRERSCEQVLEAADFQRFIRRLDRELRQRHASYDGIVLETNHRHPRYDVAPETAP